MSNFKYPKGSEWRKWDLHVHTPYSVLNNQFGNDWDHYTNELFTKAMNKGIKVIGITDYFSIEGYKKLVKEYLENEYKLKELFTEEEIEKIKQILILPNIEFRLNKFVGQNRINFHVIFSNEISIQDMKENFLHELEFVYEGYPQSEDEKWKLKINNLEELGKKLKKEHAEFANKSNLFVGMMNAVVDDSKIVKILNSKPSIFKGDYLIGIPADEDLSSIDWNSQDHLTKKIIIQKSDFIFSSNNNTRKWALGLKHEKVEDFIKEFKGLKPCIWGSDAHSYKKLFEPDLKRYTWIKADPIFEGLKQIIYEPEEKIYIGEEPPTKLDKSKIIKSITVNNSSGWFEDDKPLELNEDLLSVIGGKGTGKTAFLDLIAYATRDYRKYKEGEKSFLKKAFGELKGTKIKVEWGDSRLDEREIENKLEELNDGGKLRFIPQDFVEELCSEIGKRELEQQIENVIFQKIPKEDRANYSDFSSYKNTQLKVIKGKKERGKEQVEEINSKIYKLIELIKNKDEVESEIKKTKRKIDELNNEMQRISLGLEAFKKQKQILKKINKLNEKKSELEKKISIFQTNSLKIDDIRDKLLRFKEDTDRFIEEIRTDLKLVQISSQILKQIKIIFYPKDIEEILNKQKQGTEKEIGKKKEQLKKLHTKIQDLEGKLELEESKQDKIKEINVLLSLEKQKLDSLNEEVKKIKEANKNLPKLLKKRENLFINFFELLFKEKEKLKNIYSPLETILKESAEEHERLFKFSIQFSFNTKNMAREGDNFIDHTREGRFRHKTKEAIQEEIEKLKFTLNLEDIEMSDSDKENVKKILRAVEKLFLKDEGGKDLTIVSQLRQEYTEKDFYDWLYCLDYYNVNYSIKFNGVELDNLSPGLKGVALFILYLELDEEDTRPILIDQPEENLDNRFIYQTLMRYFRKAKKRRQIIIITHNPNLVVNTDSEQIIVANWDKGKEKQLARICYVNGSLENTFKISKNDFSEDDWNNIPDLEKKGIREHICEILEGGEEAFERRERKYGFKTS